MLAPSPAASNRCFISASISWTWFRCPPRVSFRHYSTESHKISIPHVVDLLKLLDGFRVVTRHDHRLAITVRQRQEKRCDGFGVFGIEITGGLIGKDKRGIVGEPQSDRPPLLLTAAQFLRSLVSFGTQSDHLQ